MDTEKFKRDLKLAQVKVDSAILKGKINFNRGVDNARYNAAVSKEQHRLTSERADLFTGEMLTCIKENPTGILKPLHPTAEQLQMVELILDNVEQGTIRSARSGGKLLNDRPFIYKHYNAGDPIFENRDSSVWDNLVNLLTQQEATLTTIYGVDEPFPHGISVHGSKGLKGIGAIALKTFPIKPETTEEVRKHMSIPEKQSGFTNDVGIYNGGNRIVINSTGIYDGEEISMTDSYYFIGAFDGQDTNRTYWVYGSNEDRDHKMTVREPHKATQTAFQTQ